MIDGVLDNESIIARELLNKTSQLYFQLNIFNLKNQIQE